ncbi:cytochrome P450 [Aspergillus floccosus]
MSSTQRMTILANVTRSLPGTALALVILVLVHLLTSVAYSILFHPLAKYPGPKLRAASLLPYLWTLISGRHHTSVRDLHQQYGPVVRIAPNKLSYITAQAWKDIYGHKKASEPEMAKDAKWQVADPNPPHLVYCTRDQHSHYRRLFSHGFSDRSLREQEPLLQGYIDMLMDGLERSSRENGPVDIVQWFNWTTFDIIGDLTFGESFECLEKATLHPWVSNMFQAIKGNMVIRVMQETPGLGPYTSQILRYILPGSALKKREAHFQYTRKKVHHRLSNLSPRSDFMDHVLHQPEGRGLTFPELLSNSSLLIMAGSETTATLLSGAVYLLLTNPVKMQKLVNELSNAFPDGSMINIESTSRLNYLPAVIEETLRLYPPLAVGIPRIVPDEGHVIDGQYVPGGTSVAVHHLAAYHSPLNFEQPESFIPERFIDTTGFQDQREVLQPFSIGPRNCIGKNLAYAETKLILARLFSQFELELTPESDSWIDQRTYVIWEKPPMYVSLTPRSQGG